MPEGRLHLLHAGLYAFRRPVLEEFARLEPTPLERTEGLEQLRLLEHGRTIAVGLLERPPRGIDTPPITNDSSRNGARGGRARSRDPNETRIPAKQPQVPEPKQSERRLSWSNTSSSPAAWCRPSERD